MFNSFNSMGCYHIHLNKTNWFWNDICNAIKFILFILNFKNRQRNCLHQKIENKIVRIQSESQIIRWKLGYRLILGIWLTLWNGILFRFILNFLHINKNSIILDYLFIFWPWRHIKSKSTKLFEWYLCYVQ